MAHRRRFDRELTTCFCDQCLQDSGGTGVRLQRRTHVAHHKRARLHREQHLPPESERSSASPVNSNAAGASSASPVNALSSDESSSSPVDASSSDESSSSSVHSYAAGAGLATPPNTSSDDTGESGDDESDIPEQVLLAPVFAGAKRTVAQVIYDVFNDAQSQRLPFRAVKADFARLRRTFPNDHQLPTFRRAREFLVGQASIEVVVYEMCSAGCVLYRDAPDRHDPARAHQHSNCTRCPTCRVAREGNTTEYTHVPLGPQLAGLHADPEWRAVIDRGHRLRGRREDDYMRSIHDSPAYAAFYEANPGMQGAVLGALSTDGVNPFKGVKYSMWPFMWKILNYLPDRASRTDLMLLVGIIHGPKTPKSIQPVLKLIVEDLIDLWHGLPAGDAVGEGVLPTIRACLFLVIGDYPALSKLRLQQEAGALCGCMFCDLRGEKVAVLNTVVYTAGARMLQPDDPSRGTDRTPPPRTTTTADIVCWGADVSRNVAGNAPTDAQVQAAGGVKGLTEILVAPGPVVRVQGHTVFDLAAHSPPDVLHATAGLMKGHIIPALKGEREPARPQRPTCRLTERQQRLSANEQTRLREAAQQRLRRWEDLKRQRAQFVLALRELAVPPKLRDIADRRYASIRGPPGFVRHGTLPFRRTGSNVFHDWHIWWSCGVGKFVLSPPVLTGARYKAVCALADCISTLLAANVRKVDFTGPNPPALVRLRRAVHMFEQAFPRTEHCMLLHLLEHICEAVSRLGPTFTYWMYPFERFVGMVCRSLHDKAHPAQNFVDVYQVRCGLQALRRRLPNLVTGGRNDTYSAVCNDARVVWYKVHPDPRLRGTAQALQDDIVAAALLAEPNVTPDAVRAGVQSIEAYTSGVSVRSADTRRLSVRDTSRASRARQGRRVSCSLYSFLVVPGAPARAHVVRPVCFLRVPVDGVDIHVAYVRRSRLCVCVCVLLIIVRVGVYVGTW